MVQLDLSGANNNTSGINDSEYRLGLGDYLKRLGGGALITNAVVGIPAIFYFGNKIGQSGHSSQDNYLPIALGLAVYGLFSGAKVGFEIIVNDVQLARALREIHELRREDLEGLIMAEAEMKTQKE